MCTVQQSIHEFQSSNTFDCDINYKHTFAFDILRKFEFYAVS